MAIIPQNAPPEYSQVEESQFRFDLARQIGEAIQGEGGGGSVTMQDHHGDDKSIPAARVLMDQAFQVDRDMEDPERAVVLYGPVVDLGSVSGRLVLESDMGPTQVLSLSANATLDDIANLSAPFQLLGETNGHTLTLDDTRFFGPLKVISRPKFLLSFVIAGRLGIAVAGSHFG